ncbi:MAG: TetR/AcrR family transcriptional regulator [Dehalococcoidia bacterium]
MRDARPARQEQRQQTRAKLVEAALRVFAEQGYDHATVEEISLAAGYSKGAYYFHFDSKEEVLLELLTLWIEEHTRRLRQFQELGGETTLALVKAVESLAYRDDSDAQWPLLLPEIWVQSHRNEKVRKALQDAYVGWARLLEKAFEEMERDRHVRMAVRPNVAAGLVLATYDGLALHSNVVPGRAESSRMLSALVSALLASPEQATQPVIPPNVRRTVRRKR